MNWNTSGSLFGWENDPWFVSALGGIRRVQDELNRVLNDVVENQPGGDFPYVNLWSKNDEAIVTAEIPGLDASEVDLSVASDTLTFSGEIRTMDVKEEDRVLRAERPAGRFSRTISLPFPVNAEEVKAECRNGILKVVLPRAESDKPKRIPIRS